MGLMQMTSGQFKQEILRQYNEINKRVFDVGVRRHKVEIVGNKIVIVSLNSRIPILKLVDGFDPSATRQLDRALQQYIKSEIRRLFECTFQMNVVAVLKDYDAETEHSGTIVILERDLAHYLND